MRIFLPLRFKILFTFLLLVTIVVSVITFTMANLFHTDKTTYIKDFVSTNAVHTAVETRSLLQNYLDRIKTFTRVAYDSRLNQNEKSLMFEELFADFSEMMAIAFHEDGVQQASVFDEMALMEAGISQADLDRQRARRPMPSEALQPGYVLVRNATFKETLPLMTIVTTLTLPGTEKGILVEAFVRMDRLMTLMGKSELLEAFILEPGGDLLVHKDPGRTLSGAPMDWAPDGALMEDGSSLDATFEYVVEGNEMIGSFARVETGDLMVGIQIPQRTAFLTARSLFNNLLGVSLVILIGATAISFYWSYRITRPLEQLSRATQDVGRGNFEIQLRPTSLDEIGSLTRSVNKMAYELREREKALKDAQAALIQSEKMSAFGQLSAGIAHEVKNPLAGILGYVQISLKKLKENTAVHKNLMIIEKETRRCNSIIENLMRFARQDKPQLDPLSIKEVLEDALVLVDHQLGIHEIRVEKDFHRDLAPVEGDANQLIQVFMNILINAQQAMDGSPGTITLAAEAGDEDTVVVRFKDTGPGIPPEIARKIFEPFYTTKAAGKGTGLGLAVTYGIIKDHGGEIRVESEPGQGATFIITLPAAGTGKNQVAD